MNIQKWLNENTSDLNGKVVVMTGASGGLGSRLCRYIVKLGAKLVMLDRNEEQSQKVRDAILKDFPNADIEFMKIDLYQIQMVHDVAMRLADRQIDYLILNAGVYNVPLTQGELGYNNVFQINFISQYYLAKTLMPTLARTKGKIVTTTSIAHEYGKLDEADVDFTKHAKGTQIYGNSKRFLMFALAELIKTQSDVRLALVHPGVTATPMTNHYHWSYNWLVVLTMKMMFPKPDVAALNILAGLFRDPQPDEWVGPKKAGIWGQPTITKLTATSDERTKIFNIAEDIDKMVREHIIKK